MHLSQFALNLDSAPLLHKLKAAGFLLFATTNQPCLYGGSLSRGDLERMHEALRATFPLTDILVCPHDEADHCPCRKPKPGLLVEASFKYRLNLDHSFVISDKWQDAQAAHSAGCTSLMLNSPWLKNVHRDFVLPDLEHVVDKIIALRNSRQPAAVR